MTATADDGGVMRLLPCPFCNGTASVSPPTAKRTDKYNPLDRLFPIVKCGMCFCEVWGRDGDFSGRTASIAWNTRTSREQTEEGEK